MNHASVEGPILVTGATGGIGSQVLSMLHGSGAPVRAMARRDKQVKDFKGQGIDAVLGDMSDPQSLERAMQQVDTVFLLTLAQQQQAAFGRNAVRAAERAGVRRIVHLSTGDANPNSNVPWAAAPARTDALLRISSLSWTLLKPSAFMQNMFDSAPVIRRGLLPQTTGEGVAGWIDSEDIARVASRVLVEEGHDDREYILTGPELLNMRDIAGILEQVLQHRVRFIDLPAPLYLLLLRLGGLDAWTARGVVNQFASVLRRGRDNATDLTGEVAAITGQAPRDFRSFVEIHRDRFTKR